MTVFITTDGKRITADIPYDRGRGPRDAKQIAGARPKWDKTVTPNRFLGWVYPLTIETCHAFRQVFGRDLVISENLAAWYREERDARRAMEEMRSGDVPDMPRVRQEAPALWEALNNRPFQISGASFVVQGKTVCLGDEPRLGKTYQALAAMIEAGAENVLVACPLSATKSVWQAKFEEFAPNYGIFVARGNRQQRQSEIARWAAWHGRKVLIIVKEMIRVKRMYRCMVTAEGKNTGFVLKGQPERTIRPGKKGGCLKDHKHRTMHYPEWPELFFDSWGMIILDECHHALASTKNVQSDGISQIRLGAVRLPLAENGIKLAMSGTPFRSKATKAWGVLNWLDPKFFSSYWRFAEEHFPMKSNGYGNVVGDKPMNPEAFQNAIRRYYLARRKYEVAQDLKPLEYVNIELPMDGVQGAAYNEMVEMASADIENGKLNANGLLAEITRAKQFACSYGKFVKYGKEFQFQPAGPSNKLDWLLDFLAEREETDGKVVIASQFTKFINLIREDLDRHRYPSVVITGDTTAKQRDYAQEEFLHGATRVALINVAAGGEAIDLSSADEFVLMDEPWEAWLIEQSENRIQNLAKRQQLTVFRVRSEGTIETKISKMTDEQRAILRSTRPEALELAKEVL